MRWQRRHGSVIGRQVVLAALLIAGATLAPSATAIENSATAQLGGVTLDDSAATVRLTRRSLFLTSLVAEVDSPVLYAGAIDRTLSLFANANIAVGDSGFDRFEIDLPAGFVATGAGDLSLNGTTLSASCPVPGSGEYCVSINSGRYDIEFGNPVTTDGTTMRIDLIVSTPPTEGSYLFAARAVRIFDGVALAATEGDADGDASNADSLSVDVIDLGYDPDLSSIVATPAVVLANGQSRSNVTVSLRDSQDQPLAGVAIQVVSDRGALDTLIQNILQTDNDGVVLATITSLTPGRAWLRAELVDLGLDLPQQAPVTFTQGMVLQLSKSTLVDEAVVGDVVTWQVALRNTLNTELRSVRIIDTPPRGFKYLPGGARLDGQPIADPAATSGTAALEFVIDRVAGIVDTNNNGVADAGEDGYRLLTYRLVVGSGARPGIFANSAYAIDVCQQCVISNTASAEVEVTLDPVFDLGTVIGKVFADVNGDGWQDVAEVGIAGAMVVLDDGTYALTDQHGRYHFPATRPGQRLVKLNLARLAGGARATDGPVRVLTLTPGLLAKANFGVHFGYDQRAIGRAGILGVSMTSDTHPADILVSGSARIPVVAVNGVPVDLRRGVVRLRQRTLRDVVNLDGDALEHPVGFDLTGADTADLAGWRVAIRNLDGTLVRKLAGRGSPPPTLTWDGRDESGQLVGAGQVYAYQLELEYADGGVGHSERRLFGVNRSSTVAVSLRGGAFVTGSAELTDEATELLRATGKAIRKLPRDKILIEGHTDSIGAEQTNLALSEQRAQAAYRYLVDIVGLPADRFDVVGYGEQRPLASNHTDAGRRLNRRVEIKGELTETDRATIGLRQRQPPAISINGVAIQLADSGRYSVSLDGATTNAVRFELSSASAETLQGTVPLPSLDILQPGGEFQLAYGTTTRDYAVAEALSPLATDSDAVVIEYRLAGHTNPGNSVTINGASLPVGDDGGFYAPLKLRAGENVFGLVALNNTGFSRIVNLSVRVRQSDENGPVVVVEPIPELVVQLPPPGLPLANRKLGVPGVTTPGNRIHINDAEVDVQADGSFFASVDLPAGQSTLVAEVTDKDGYTGRIEQVVEVREQKYFFLALADGKFSQLKRRGNISNDGSGTSMRTEGRLAWYFKGEVAGRYLITSAFDSGLGKAGELFDDLDDSGNARLLSNIDPDTIYPVYGDDSTLVYDAQSSGKFYLAIESDQLDALYGNYPVNLNAGELTAYQRTLYGAHASYRSAGHTSAGTSRTRMQVFAADVRHSAVRDVLAATGGSLYYLSRDEIIEGSEQIAIVVRDRDTGLILSRTRQLRNEDYSIKYSRGRVLFNRPVSSINQDASLIDQDLLSGNPVSIEVDYETRLEGFTRSAYGGHIAQELGERVTVGLTSVTDEALDENYQMQGVNAELRLGKSTRLSAEVARSSGSGTITNLSHDGGLTYQQTQTGGGEEGDAYKLTAEIDAGDFISATEGLRLAAYLKRVDGGFRANGNAAESGTRKSGLQLSYEMGDGHSIVVRHDRQRSLVDDNRMDQSTLHWTRTAGGWKLSTEIQDRQIRTGAVSQDSMIAAARVRYAWSGKLSSSLEQQYTLRGTDNNQTTVALDYQLTDSIALQASISSGTQGTAGQLGARFEVDGRQYYLSQRHDTDISGRGGTVTVFGAEAPLGENGRMYSEYQFGDPRAGTHQSLLGLRRRWDLTEKMNFLLGAEQASFNTEAGSTQRFALSTAFNFDNQRGLTLSTRNEYRSDSGPIDSEQYVSLNNILYKLGDDLTILGKYRYALAETALQTGQDAQFDELSIGLAFRPVAHDRFNALARFTRLSDEKTAIGGENQVQGASDVWSAEWSFQINRYFEWVGKHAFKTRRTRFEDGDAFTTHTQLAIQRVNWRLPRELAFATEFRVLSQREADDRRAGWLTEIHWTGIEHLRLGVGYNFTDFSDNEFDDNGYSEQGWFLRLQGTY